MSLNQKLDRIDGLHPMLHKPALALIEQCQTKLHRSLMVVFGWRSVQEQLLVYQKGRELNRETERWEIVDKTQVVTNALPGTSAHNVITIKGDRASMAMDVIPLFPDGTIDWTPDDDFWDALYELSWKIGMDPYGDPIGAYLASDKGHFEEPCWKLKIESLGCMLPVSQ